MAARPGFGELFAALPVAVLVVGPDDRIAHANGRAEMLLQLSERVMVGQPLTAILPPPTDAGRRDGHGLAIYDTQITTGRGHRVRADFVETAIADYPGWRAISLHTAASARGFGHSAHRAAGPGPRRGRRRCWLMR